MAFYYLYFNLQLVLKQVCIVFVLINFNLIVTSCNMWKWVVKVWNKTYVTVFCEYTVLKMTMYD